jgi:hypothetical protein
MGQAMYGEPPGAAPKDNGTGGGETGREQAGPEDVVEGEFTEA